MPRKRPCGHGGAAAKRERQGSRGAGRRGGGAMNALKRWAIAAGVLLLGRKQRRPLVAEPERLVEAGQPDPRAEWLVLALLLGAACAAAGFIAVFSFTPLEHQQQFPR